MAFSEQKVNLQRELDKRLDGVPKNAAVLLHCCCAPCSTYCLQYLSRRKLNLTLYYCNDNIDTAEEYFKRAEELERFNRGAGYGYPIITEDYRPELFRQAVKGVEHTGERGERCKRCFLLRLKAAQDKAADIGAKYFLTTLSISPHKDAALLYEIGGSVSDKAEFLPSDFKKDGGFVRSGQICNEFGLYRQDYCGCVFSKAERLAAKENKAEIKV